MKLSLIHSEPSPVREKFITAFDTFVQGVEKVKYSLTEEQKTRISDAMVIGQAIKDRLSESADEDIKPSLKRFSAAVTAAFQADFFSVEMREEIRKNQLDRVEELGARTIGEGKIMLSKYYDANNNIDCPKTASAVEPAKIAERLMRALRSREYPNMQEAYDGFTNEDKHNAVWPYASAKQKCVLGRILTAWGFKINYDKWETAWEKDKQLLEKKYRDIGKGDRKKEDRMCSRGEKDVKADDDQFGRKPPPETDKDYNRCSKCKKTTTWKGGKCTECGAEPAQKVKAISDDAEKEVSKKIEKVKNDKPSTSNEQAAAIAYEEAREKGYKIPEKKGQYDPKQNLDSASGPTDQINQRPEMTKTGMGYTCGNTMCKYSEMYPQEGKYNCPKCGGMMVKGDAGMGVAGNPDRTPQVTPGAGHEQAGPSNYGKDGFQYMSKVQEASKKNIMLSLACVKEMGIKYAETMERLGMTAVRARYLEKWLLNNA